MNGVSDANVVKWKVSKRALKHFVHLHVDGRACISLSLALCVSLSRLYSCLSFDGMSEMSLLKFSGPVQLCSSNF